MCLVTDELQVRIYLKLQRIDLGQVADLQLIVGCEVDNGTSSDSSHRRVA